MNFAIAVDLLGGAGASLPSGVTPTLLLDANTINQSDNTTVASGTWANQGSAGGTLSVIGGAPKLRTNVLNGRKVVRYIRTNSDEHQLNGKTFADIATSGHFTCFFLGINNADTADAGADGNGAVMSDSGGFFDFGVSNSANKLFDVMSFPSMTYAGAQTLNGQPVIAAVRVNGTTNGVQVTSGAAEVTTTGTSLTALGGAPNFGRGFSVYATVDISYLVAYNVELTAAQRAQVFAYLRALGGSGL